MSSARVSGGGGSFRARAINHAIAFVPRDLAHGAARDVGDEGPHRREEGGVGGVALPLSSLCLLAQEPEQIGA